MKRISDRALRHLQQVVVLPDLSGTPYRIIRKIGQGGMGTVYLAEDTRLCRKIAIKVMNLPVPSEEMVSRMTAEARIIARLEHPSIIPIHDVGRLPDNRIFYVMKWIQGSNLLTLAPRIQTLAEKLRLFLKVCEAIRFAHARGVIHRDLKPANIMVGSFGEVLVMDWGVAKALHGISEEEDSTDSTHSGGKSSFHYDEIATSHGMTEDGAIVGTAAYMAPEQSQGQISHQSEFTDIYALGAILYFLLTGFPPQFSHFGSSETHYLLPPSPRKMDSKIHRVLDAICMKTLAPDPNQRYCSVESMAEDIERFLGGFSVSVYHENLIEKILRWMKNNRFIVLLLLTYMMVRIILYFLVRF